MTVRGFRRERVFKDGGDHEEFMFGFHELNAALPPSSRLQLMANAQMGNHQHLFVENGQQPDAITDVMHSLCTEYAMSFNWRNRRAGQVFERPFRGKVIRGGAHVANTFVYIHLNPDHSLRINNSSHAVYSGLREDPHINKALAWRTFDGSEGYQRFFEDTARLRAARDAAKRRLEDW